LVDEQYGALDGADAMILITEWKPFRHPDFGRIGKIMKEAAEQSGRGIVPELSDALSFEKALAHAKKNDANFFFHTAHAGAGEEPGGVWQDRTRDKGPQGARRYRG